MYFGKVLKVFITAAVFFAVSFLCLPGVSLAADVWCCSRNGRSFYLDSESINAETLPGEMDYRGSVKVVRESDGSLEKTVIYGFESQNDVLVGAIYDKSAGNWVFPEYKSEKPVMTSVWETMKPYMKQKRIPYSDSWTWK